MRALHTYDVVPFLPKELERLRELAFNLRWAWDGDTADLFVRLERDLWDDAKRNPIKVLGEIRQERLDEVARDEAFMTHFRRVCDRFDAAMTRRPWFDRIRDNRSETQVAYFSMEYGIAESLPIYSGGLGVLSGDHLKSASDLGIPLVGVGLMYQEGYFRQYLNPDGWQQELYPENDFSSMPVQLERDEDGNPRIVAVPFPGRDVWVRIWRVQVGRVQLVLLDTNTPQNSIADQDVTDRLYGVGTELRIQQEMILGIGGVRALRELGLEASVFHMNEGHSAFLALERIRWMMAEHGLDLAAARELVAAGNCFTTHTPVPAGIDRFSQELMAKYFEPLLPQLGMDIHQLMDLGRLDAGRQDESLSMAVLALRLSHRQNGVSQVHAQVSRKMWCDLWPGAACEEVPIAGITNGVHAPTWISAEMKGLFDRYLGPQWRELPEEEGVWNNLEQIPSTELWRTHERRRERLVAFARNRLKAQITRRGGTRGELALADEVLDPEALTIGFARRFATYKRSTLLLADKERLLRLLTNRERPVQIIFAGKAHPADDPGKKMIQEIVHLSRKEEFRHRMVFVEDYDMATARYLVQGVDIWLNTPRRPKEASGTSGMKAAMNGALNVSTLDGWWVEAYQPNLGWAIGDGEEYQDIEYGDRVEASALHNLLEREIVPMFYDRGSDGLPRDWIQRMKRSTQVGCHRYNTARMVRQYAIEMYLPADDHAKMLAMDGNRRGTALARWREKVASAWAGVALVDVRGGLKNNLKVGDQMEVEAKVRLGELDPSDVEVEVYHGDLDMRGELTIADRQPMEFVGEEDGVQTYRALLFCSRSGRHGYSVRVVPHHEDLPHHLDTRLINWG